jgi:hypothetical protein
VSEPGFNESGPLDVPTLEVLKQRAVTHQLVTDAAFQPDSLAPRLLEVTLDSGQYPSRVSGVRLDIRWFEGGDYSIHYVEIQREGTWQCRWDRHPKPEAPPEHFHPPPNAGTTVQPSSLASDHHLSVLFGVLDWSEDRLQEHYDE